jgi:hypothetical protein
MPKDPNNRHAIEMDLQRRILHGLAAEWELAWWRLPAAVRNRLRKPQFRIADLKSTWGQWSAPPDTITMSRRLVSDHPWDAIRDVLLHEMAHQIAHVLFNGRVYSPHGDEFDGACRLVGASRRAAGNYPLLHDRLDVAALNDEDRIRLKVKKLLALADSNNPNEAAAALAKARQFMTQYQIASLEAHGGEADYVSVFIGRPALRHTRDHTYLGGLLSDFYFVEAIWVPSWVLDREKVGSVLEISGTPVNVRMAGYVHDYIRRFIDQQWARYTVDRNLTKHRKTDYAVGIVQGFRTQLEQARCTCESGMASDTLVRAKDPHLAAYMKRRYPRTRTVHTRVSHADAQVTRDGRREGRRLRIAHPVEGAPTQPTHLEKQPSTALPPAKGLK